MIGQRAAYKVHSWTGLFTGWLLFVICLTGTLAVYKFEIKALSNPDFATVETARQLSPDEALASFGRAFPDAKVTMLAFPTDAYSFGQYSLKAKTGDAKEKRYWVHPQTGAVRSELQSDYADFIQRLHANLFFGHEGQWFVGLLGVTMLVSVIAGLWFHWPHIRRDLFHLRLRAHRRKAWADLHKFFGVWGLPFLLIIAATGAWLGIETVLHIPAGNTKPVEVAGEGPGNPLPLAAILSRAHDLRSDVTPTHINFQNFGAAGASLRVQGDLPGHRLVQRGQTMLVFDADTGRHLQTVDRTQQGIGRHILAMVRPLHYGYFAPPVSEAVYFLFGAACTLVIGSGLFIWAERERRKAHPRNPAAITGMERANAGVMGGLILCLALFTLVHFAARAGVAGQMLSSLGDFRFLGGQNFSSKKPIAAELWLFLGAWGLSGAALAFLNPLKAWWVALIGCSVCCLGLIPLLIVPFGGTALLSGAASIVPATIIICCALAGAGFVTSRRLVSRSSVSSIK